MKVMQVSKIISFQILTYGIFIPLLTIAMLPGGSGQAQGSNSKDSEGSINRIVMLGDSITRAGEWESLLHLHKVINRGVAGYSTGDVLREVNETIALKPTKIFLMIGINDLLRGSSFEQTFQTYSTIINRLQGSGAKIYVQSTLECARNYCGETTDAVKELNAKVKKLASSLQLTYIDLNAGLANAEQGLLPQFTHDGLHLSKLAYQYWAEQLKLHIE
jgi:lysophospholipase L1-like esterase